MAEPVEMPFGGGGLV